MCIYTYIYIYISNYCPISLRFGRLFQLGKLLRWQHGDMKTHQQWLLCGGYFLTRGNIVILPYFHVVGPSFHINMACWDPALSHHSPRIFPIHRSAANSSSVAPSTSVPVAKASFMAFILGKSSNGLRIRWAPDSARFFFEGFP